VFDLAEAPTRRAGLVSAVQLLALSFAALIAVGTIGLLVLPGLYTGPRLGVVDALFTATSAVCVTGLIVVDTATYFTRLGQAWIVLLIQLGGLGIITITTVVIAALGRRVTLRASEATTGSLTPALPRHASLGLVRAIVTLTLVVETAGALLLWLLWGGRLGWGGAVWPAVFHAISAFCNAGFSTFSDSLVGFRAQPAVLVVVAALIVTGGIGFILVEDVRRWCFGGKPRRLSTHTVVTLATTVILIGVGLVLFAVFERSGTLAGLSWPQRAANGLFMAVTPRTAGFNTVNYDAVSDPSLVLTMVYMFIGGSPGSTAGGIKTTTAALLVLLLVSRLRGQSHVRVRGRTVPDETVNRAAALAVGAVAVLVAAVFVLIVTDLPANAGDRFHLVRLAFEATSAFGTVGLSMGATPHLTALGKLVITGLMFVGRVGPLTLAAAMAFAGARRRLHYRFAHEDVVVG
jgi:trk system potassium uptake protein TrkH